MNTADIEKYSAKMKMKLEIPSNEEGEEGSDVEMEKKE